MAATGRLSSHDPNLQNIPVRTFEGRRIRDGFVADEGCVLMSADYSQVELRVLAHLSGTEPLIASFRNQEDIHRRTASEIFAVDMADVTASQRTAAKAINFGLMYGMSAFRLGRDLSISRDDAQRYMDEYFGRMPAVSAWIDGIKEQCRRQGFVRTLFGRRRLIPEIYSKDYGDRMAAEREAVNTVVQGTAADLMKLAMIRVHRALDDSGMDGEAGAPGPRRAADRGPRGSGGRGGRPGEARDDGGGRAGGPAGGRHRHTDTTGTTPMADRRPVPQIVRIDRAVQRPMLPEETA